MSVETDAKGATPGDATALGAAAEPQSTVLPLTPAHEDIVKKALNLYQLDESEPNFDMFTDEAVFEDPIAIAQGIRNVKAQWYTMPKVFSKSETLVAEPVLTRNPDQLRIKLEQKYTMRPFGYTFVMPSTVVLHLDGLKVVKMQDLWHSKPLSDGWISRSFRSSNAALVSLFFAPKRARGGWV